MQSSALLHIAAVLLDKALCPLAKMLNRLGRPPVLEVAHLVVLPSLVIEAMRQFVANHHTDKAVIEGKRTGGVKEGRLEDAGGDS